MRRDLLARLRGTGTRRLLLIGHLDTVHAHEAHKPAAREGDRLVGPGTVDMKGGDVLALGVLRALVPLSAALRGDRAAVRERRGVADRPPEARGEVRGLGRLPLLRGRARPARTARTR